MMENMLLFELLNDDGLDLNLLEPIIQELGNPAFHAPEERHEPTRNQGYFEETIHTYTLEEFRDHFRMARATFEELSIQIAANLDKKHRVDLNKKILYTIWTLAKPESFLAASDRFGISKGTGHYIFLEIVSAITRLQNTYIKWPTPQECTAIAARVENRYGIPGVVGAIDGTHIQIKQPTNNAVDFYNRKEHHSVILQAVCDDKKIFTDIFVGMPGRMHDARVFRNSPLYHQLQGVPPLLQQHEHILGDAAYPLLQNLLKPYTDNGHLTHQQTLYNQRTSAQRSVIEIAFALLKGKWRRLKFLDMSLAAEIPNVIAACCILHNFILQQNELFQDNNYYDDGNIENNPANEDNEINESGTLKRNYIASILR